MIIKTDICDEYWRFAYLRQLTFLRNHAQSVPFNPDAIIESYKFTNCYRACDRVSQFLISNISNSESCPENIFFRTVLFKLFNKIGTWLSLSKELGMISFEGFEPNLYSEKIMSIINSGDKVYSAAYIMPSGKKEFGSPRKHENNFLLLEMMLKDELHKKIWDYKNLKSVYEAFLSYPTIGPFLAYQYAIDIAYSGYSEAKESDYVVAGPGALRGIKKCFSSIGGYTAADVIKYMVDNQEAEFERLGLDFKYLKNRKLQLIDCQNLFCEFDKYCRVKYPNIVVGNTRIKQKYKPNSTPIEYEFPIKWNAGLPE